MVDQTVVHELPEVDGGLNAAATPPEPGVVVLVAACRLVERTPDNGHACFLQLLEIAGHLVDVLEDDLVLPGAFGEGIGDVEVGVLAVEGVLVPVLVVVGVFVGGDVPVPHVAYEAAGVPLCGGCADVGVVDPVLAAALVVEEVVACQSGILACVAAYPVGKLVVVAVAGACATEHLLAVLLEEHVVDGLGRLGGVGVDEACVIVGVDDGTCLGGEVHRDFVGERCVADAGDGAAGHEEGVAGGVGQVYFEGHYLAGLRVDFGLEGAVVEGDADEAVESHGHIERQRDLVHVDAEYVAVGHRYHGCSNGNAVGNHIVIVLVVAGAYHGQHCSGGSKKREAIDFVLHLLFVVVVSPQAEAGCAAACGFRWFIQGLLCA